MKGNKGKGIDLAKTMPLWPKNTENTIKKLEEPFYLNNIIKTNLQYLQNMKTDTVTSYTSLYKMNISRIEKRKLKKRKEISVPSCSSVMTNQEISYIHLDDSCNSDLDVA